MNVGSSNGDSQFQIIRNSDFTFADVGGYNNIKNEEGLKLSKIFTYKNTLKNIIKHFDI